jgi:hypothetical protein
VRKKTDLLGLFVFHREITRRLEDTVSSYKESLFTSFWVYWRLVMKLRLPYVCGPLRRSDETQKKRDFAIITMILSCLWLRTQWNEWKVARIDSAGLPIVGFSRQ